MQNFQRDQSIAPHFGVVIWVCSKREMSQADPDLWDWLWRQGLPDIALTPLGIVVWDNLWIFGSYFRDTLLSQHQIDG